MNRLPLVLLLLVSIVAWGQSAAPPSGEPAAQNEIQKWLATMDAQYQPIFTREVTDLYDAEIARLQQLYLATLDANMAKATSAGNLDLTLLWRNERVRFLAAKDMPSTDDAADPTALKAARAAVRTQAARLETDRAAHAKLVYDRYDRVLAQAQIQLTQRQRIDDALAVKTKREEIAKAWLAQGAAASATKTENHDSAATPHPANDSRASEAGRPASAAEMAKPLAEFLGGTKWLWEGSKDHLLEFRKDGKVDLDFWKATVTDWKVTGTNQVTFTMHRKSDNVTAVITFTDDRSAFSGIAFVKTRVISKCLRAPASDSGSGL